MPERQLSLEEEIDRGQFERIIMPLVVKSGEAIDEALKLRGMRPKDIDRVLLVGGTSKIPLVKRTSPRNWPARSRSRSTASIR